MITIVIAAVFIAIIAIIIIVVAIGFLMPLRLVDRRRRRTVGLGRLRSFCGVRRTPLLGRWRRPIGLDLVLAAGRATAALRCRWRRLGFQLGLWYRRGLGLRRRV